MLRKHSLRRRSNVEEVLPSRPARPDTNFPTFCATNWSPDGERDRALNVRSDDGLPLFFH